MKDHNFPTLESSLSLSYTMLSHAVENQLQWPRLESVQVRLKSCTVRTTIGLKRQQ